MALEIKPAKVEDISLILSLIKELADYERMANEVVCTEEMLENELFGKNPSAEVVLAYENDVAAGFALFFHNFSTFKGKKGLYLEDLYVKPEFRNKGIGKALLVHLAKIAKSRNCARFEWSVLDWNEPSIQFYKNFGAVPMDEWTIFRVSGNALNNLAEK